MSVSTDGVISFGFKFEEGFAFPWSAEDENGDPTNYNGMEGWWIEARGWKPAVYPFDDKGMYLPGYSDNHPDVNRYFDERRKFLKAHPIPVEDVNYCSGDYPMVILALSSSIIIARRGDPTPLGPDSLRVTTAEEQTLIDFCKEYRIQTEEERPRWWLSSYWG